VTLIRTAEDAKVRLGRRFYYSQWFGITERRDLGRSALPHRATAIIQFVLRPDTFNYGNISPCHIKEVPSWERTESRDEVRRNEHDWSSLTYYFGGSTESHRNMIAAKMNSGSGETQHVANLFCDKVTSKGFGPFRRKLWFRCDQRCMLFDCNLAKCTSIRLAIQPPHAFANTK